MWLRLVNNEEELGPTELLLQGKITGVAKVAIHTRSIRVRLLVRSVGLDSNLTALNRDSDRLYGWMNERVGGEKKGRERNKGTATETAQITSHQFALNSRARVCGIRLGMPN